MPGPGGMLDRGTSRRHILLQVEESLRRLRTDWIDLYQIHRNDKDTPLEETLGALTDLVRQGKVRYLGVSTGTLAESRCMYFGGWRMVESLWISERRQLERFVSTQPPYSIFTREAEREIFPVCEAHGFGAIVWSPLEGGWLAGRYRKGKPVPADSRARNETEFGAFVAPRFDMNARGRRAGSRSSRSWPPWPTRSACRSRATPTAWTLRNPAVTSAIIGRARDATPRRCLRAARRPHPRGARSDDRPPRVARLERLTRRYRRPAASVRWRAGASSRVSWARTASAVARTTARKVPRRFSGTR